jgi:hypothetical protein
MQVAMLHYSDRPIYELWKINNQPTSTKMGKKIQPPPPPPPPTSKEYYHLLLQSTSFILSQTMIKALFMLSIVKCNISNFLFKFQRSVLVSN